MITCKHCNVEKLESDMSIWAGKPSKVCIECKAKHPTGAAARGVNGNGGVGTSKKRAAAVRRPKRAAADLAITLHPGGFGCSARLTEEGYLQITQSNDEAVRTTSVSHGTRRKPSLIASANGSSPRRSTNHTIRDQQ